LGNRPGLLTIVIEIAVSVGINISVRKILILIFHIFETCLPQAGINYIILLYNYLQLLYNQKKSTGSKKSRNAGFFTAQLYNELHCLALPLKNPTLLQKILLYYFLLLSRPWLKQQSRARDYLKL
jgi:hypothetical protein